MRAEGDCFLVFDEGEGDAVPDPELLELEPLPLPLLLEPEEELEAELSRDDEPDRDGERPRLPAFFASFSFVADEAMRGFLGLLSASDAELSLERRSRGLPAISLFSHLKTNPK